jgi:hypothetical protein
VRASLDSAKQDGWAVSVETFLASVRPLMNPQAMQGFPLRARYALRVVRAELSGQLHGEVISTGESEDRFLLKAAGRKQVMDFHLVQTAEKHSLRLVTFDGGTLATWPTIAVPV